MLSKLLQLVQLFLIKNLKAIKHSQNRALFDGFSASENFF